jgi:hypothetical protein
MEVILEEKNNSTPFEQKTIRKNEHRLNIVFEFCVPRGYLHRRFKDKWNRDAYGDVHNQEINFAFKRHM